MYIQYTQDAGNLPHGRTYTYIAYSLLRSSKSRSTVLCIRTVTRHNPVDLGWFALCNYVVVHAYYVQIDPWPLLTSVRSQAMKGRILPPRGERLVYSWRFGEEQNVGRGVHC